MHDTLDYFGVDPLFRKSVHEKLTFAMWYEYSERFLNPLSHDEVVHGKGSLLKRMPGSGFRPAEGMKLVASRSVGAKERVVVVDVNGQQLLLGITAGGISALHALPEPLPAPAPATLPHLKHLPNFAQLLQQKLRKDA